ncbi:MAG: hypothetical protein JXB49_10375 [Bacteroidales bacterium]|nr:hypothetical protein [Bacteroidales bacterium]
MKCRIVRMKFNSEWSTLKLILIILELIKVFSVKKAIFYRYGNIAMSKVDLPVKINSLSS